MAVVGSQRSLQICCSVARRQCVDMVQNLRLRLFMLVRLSHEPVPEDWWPQPP